MSAKAVKTTAVALNKPTKFTPVASVASGAPAEIEWTGNDGKMVVLLTGSLSDNITIKGYRGHADLVVPISGASMALCLDSKYFKGDNGKVTITPDVATISVAALALA